MSSESVAVAVKPVARITETETEILPCSPPAISNVMLHQTLTIPHFQTLL